MVLVLLLTAYHKDPQSVSNIENLIMTIFMDVVRGPMSDSQMRITRDLNENFNEILLRIS